MNNKDFDLKEREIFELFNEIKIEESEFDDMDREISDIEKEKIKKNLNKKIRGKKHIRALKYGSIAAAISIVALIGVGKASPAFAENIPILNSIIQTLNDNYGDHGQYAKYSEIVDKSVTDKGITLTINEVIADDSKLIIGYTVKSDKKIKDLEVLCLGSSLKINGRSFGSSGSASGKYVDDYTYIGSEEISPDLVKMPKRFNIDLNITEVGSIKGKWNFDFTASKEEICKKSTVFKPNKKLDFPDSTINIDKVVFSPIDISIFINGDYKDKSTGASPSNMFECDYWFAYDDKGVQLQPKTIGAGSANKEHFSSEMSFVSLKDIPKYLTVIPCSIIPSGGGGITVDKDGNETPVTIETKQSKEISKTIDGVYPMQLSQGKMGKLIIKEIKREKDKTIVKFIAEGKAPYTQAEVLYIKDDKGEHVKSKDHDIRKNEKKPNEFTKVFEELHPNKKYSICTNDFANYEVREDLKFNIEFNK